jgi:hypothetical protein
MTPISATPRYSSKGATTALRDNIVGEIDAELATGTQLRHNGRRVMMEQVVSPVALAHT